MTLKNAQPTFDPATRYRIKLRGRIDVEWGATLDNGLLENHQREGRMVLPWGECMVRLIGFGTNSRYRHRASLERLNLDVF